MAKRKMQKKALNLADHKSRLASHGVAQGSGNAWLVALIALSSALALLYFFR